MTLNNKRGGTPQPAPEQDIASMIARYKGRIEATKTDVSDAETRLGEAKVTLKAASSAISSALEASRTISASLETPGPDGPGQTRVQAARKHDAAAIGFVERVLSGAAKLNEAIDRNIDDVLRRAEGLKQSIGTLGAFVGTAETGIAAESREGFLENIAPGFNLIERSVANLKRGVEETCAGVAEFCDEKSTAMILAKEVLAKVPAIPPVAN